MEPVVVAFEAHNETWSLNLETRKDQRPYLRLTCVAPDGRSWSGEAEDVFQCLMEVRRKVESVGARICCNGARLDAWSSGMQRDIAMGHWCYLVAGVPKGQHPPSVKTLDPTDPDEAVLVEEQIAWHERWVAERGLPSS